MRRILPHPYLSLTLALLWIGLANRLAPATLVLAVVVAISVPLITAPFWPDRPRIKRPFALLAYTVLVLWDVVVSSVQVARIILFMPPDQIKSALIPVPIDLPSPEAVTLLAGTITMTPGTLTAEISKDGKQLLIHSLHAPDPDAIRDDIKSRYEARLKRIFA